MQEIFADLKKSFRHVDTKNTGFIRGKLDYYQIFFWQHHFVPEETEVIWDTQGKKMWSKDFTVNKS